MGDTSEATDEVKGEREKNHPLTDFVYKEGHVSFTHDHNSYKGKLRHPNTLGGVLKTKRGLILQPYPGAPIVAPLDGEVRFAGNFRGYGELLILEHSGGYHSLIAGFGRLDARVGQQVLAGEPVGVTALPQSGTTDNPTLYFEFRSNGQPINLVQGLAMARESVRG